ncbi:PAS domain-containing protein [Ureibacillus sp. GCM10028918]|uniref:PAS domain-containing protein n=1 Tax=Ureibacillus sp. GCM10028918 TaxID=3273429 RepID=UPI003608D13D
MREKFNNFQLNQYNGNLLHTTNLFLTVLGNINEGIMVTDDKMKILFVNSAFETVKGKIRGNLSRMAIDY